MDIKQQFVRGISKQLAGMVVAARATDMKIPELEAFLTAAVAGSPPGNVFAQAVGEALKGNR